MRNYADAKKLQVESKGIYATTKSEVFLHLRNYAITKNEGFLPLRNYATTKSEVFPPLSNYATTKSKVLVIHIYIKVWKRNIRKECRKLLASTLHYNKDGINQYL